jgi:hypothetical protein
MKQNGQISFQPQFTANAALFEFFYEILSAKLTEKRESDLDPL